jgi:2-amino-4-hydroxy-6-hydroxymethyldihydropteridine diphosphokinase
VSTAYLGIGSNVDARRNIGAGLQALSEEFGDLALSPVYLSRAFGFEGNDFINLVAAVETDRQPLALKVFLRNLEAGHGRTRDVPRFSDRTLDVDILLYDDLRLISPALELPRPEIYSASYVLRPLSELAPELVDPISGRTFSELWDKFSDKNDGLQAIDSFS